MVNDDWQRGETRREACDSMFSSPGNDFMGGGGPSGAMVRVLICFLVLSTRGEERERDAWPFFFFPSCVCGRRHVNTSMNIYRRRVLKSFWLDQRISLFWKSIRGKR